MVFEPWEEGWIGQRYLRRDVDLGLGRRYSILMYSEQRGGKWGLLVS